MNCVLAARVWEGINLAPLLVSVQVLQVCGGLPGIRIQLIPLHDMHDKVFGVNRSFKGLHSKCTAFTQQLPEQLMQVRPEDDARA